MTVFLSLSTVIVSPRNKRKTVKSLGNHGGAGVAPSPRLEVWLPSGSHGPRYFNTHTAQPPHLGHTSSGPPLLPHPPLLLSHYYHLPIPRATPGACLVPRSSLSTGLPGPPPSLPWWPQSSRGLRSSAGGSSSDFSSFFFTSRTFSNRLIRRLPRVASSSGSSSSPSS